MATRESNLLHQMKPPPPPHLSKELLGVWSAWSRMNDREVVREAVAKGLHVNWAHTFLSARNSIDAIKIADWFKNEVFVWVQELLSRRQVFKASHILTNIGLNPVEEFTKIFLESFDPGLRDYLGAHLEKMKQLEDRFRDAWNLLRVIEEKSDLADVSECLKELNVKAMCDCNLEWKSLVATELFFKTYDAVLKPFVTPECAWKFLLQHNHLDLLKLWINVQFTKSQDFTYVHLNPQAFQQLNHMFLNFRIDENLVNLVSDKTLNICREVQEEVLNELSKFGVFTNTEGKDIEVIVSRLTYNENLISLHEILNQEASFVNLFHFNELLIKFCVEKQLWSVLNTCNIDFKLHSSLQQMLQSKHLDLICYLRNHYVFNSELIIGQNIIKISELLCGDNGTHPLIILGILTILRIDFNIMTLCDEGNTEIEVESFVVSSETMKGILNALPFLNAITNRSTNHSITYCSLLKAHRNFNVDLVNFKLEDNTVPNFNSDSLVNRYGYSKILNYTFYLKQCRPSFATTVITVHAKDSKDIIRKVLKLASRYFLQEDIVSGCVAFLEMIGCGSHELRVCVETWKILCNSDNIDAAGIQQFQPDDVESRKAVLGMLEQVLLKDFSLLDDYSGISYVEEIKKHEIAIKFSRLYNLDLPELFLEECAKNNLWLPFLLYIQIHAYPLSVIQKLVHSFSNCGLSEHLLHSLSYDIQLEDQRSALMREHDSRKSYLSRIGVRKYFEGSSGDTAQSSTSSYGSYGSTSSSSGSSDFTETELLDCKTDLLQTLIKCHNSIDPPKALLQACYIYKSPIFAILATSYEPDSIVTNWLTWLSISSGIDNKFYSLESTTINAHLVAHVLKCCLRKGCGKILLESLEIFLPDNPLRVFIEFLNNCVDLNLDPTLLTSKLTNFESQLKQRRNSVVIMDVDYEMMFLSSKLWLEQTSCTLLATVLCYNFTSPYHKMRFLKLLHEVHFHTFFSVQIPDFSKLYNLLDYLFQSKCDITLDLSVIFDGEAFQKEILQSIHGLVSQQCYDYSFKIAQLYELPTDFIVVSEWQDKFSVDKQHEKDFWRNCNDTFKSTGVQANIAVDFFQKCFENTEDKIEKCHILNIAYQWADSHNLCNLYDIEKQMWLAYFNVEAKMSECNFSRQCHSKILYGEMKQKLQNLHNNDNSEVVINTEHAQYLDRTIEKLLNLGNLWQALRLARIFNYESTDLEIIVLCCSLAEGFLMPYQMSAEQRMLLHKVGSARSLSHRRHRTVMSSRRLSSLSSASHSPVASTIVPLTDHVDTPFQDTLVTLEALVERVKNGSDIAQNVLMVYRISVNVDKPYQEVFKCADPILLLKEALRDDCNNKLEVVHDFCMLFKWTKEMIADLLCEELVVSISDHIKLKLDPITLWGLNLDTDFHLILQLLVENCSVLGLKLYLFASSLHKFEAQLTPDFRISEINLVVELLIRSHDCFTADCNMEGISTILRKCQAVVSLLLTLKSWKLIVRLLTGVARYTEMNYVLHILKENDQFEFLLRKGSRKDNGLKVALLKYLKKYCPDDRELYRMVALHFTLFSEIAQLWEEEAKSVIRNLIAISKLEMQNNGLNVETEPYVLFTNTDGTKLCLNKAMVNYTHATEYHLQGEKLAKAMNSAKQAELLALQISMLKGLTSTGTAICILNVSDTQICSLISSKLSFPQSLILVEAYNHKADWASTLFEQFVVSNNSHFLDGFLNALPLTDTLINDVSRKFLSSNAISDTTTKNMKELVKKSSSVRTKYRIASELGFTDLVEDLLAGNQLAFLKDTVWKKGYKSW